MKVAVIGSRTFNNYELLVNVLSNYNITEIISGGAIGADSLAEKYCREYLGVDPVVFLPKFKRDKNVPYHPKWFFERNKEIVEHSDFIISFWDGKSKGTKHAINYSKSIKKSLEIIYYNKIKNCLDIGNIFC